LKTSEPEILELSEIQIYVNGSEKILLDLLIQQSQVENDCLSAAFHVLMFSLS